MRKFLTAIAATATIALVSVASPQPAAAYYHHHGHYYGGAVIGGLAAGALLGAAIANGPYYGPYAYAPGPYYYGPDCYWTHERYWNGWRWHWRRVRVCD
jgi:hypothetical protein